MIRSIMTALLLLLAAGADVQAARQMENLGRGVVAVRSSSTGVFITWRLLGLDPSGIGFNVYRSTAGGAATKLNTSVLTAGTCYAYTETSANLAKDNAYYVRPVIGGVEQTASASYTLKANTTSGEPLFTVPMQAPANSRAEKVWVGDLDGDGEYEYVVCWTGTITGQTQKLQAYKRDGTLLWTADFGPNSVDPDNIYPNAAAISAGQNDGVTVYDLDGDGRAEVIVKSANGVTFGDGAVLNYGDNVTQFLSVLDGMTGAEKVRAVLPNPWKNDNNWPLGAMFGIGYFDGERPSLVIQAKVRTGGGGTPFNTIDSAWDYRGGVLSNRWSIQWNGAVAPEGAHTLRVLDLDGDGKDELSMGVYAIDDNGTLLYDLNPSGIHHGDRFQIGDLNPNRPGLEMYFIQQNNSSGLAEVMTDAGTGQIIWQNNIGSVVDAGRGSAIDIDPRYPGAECWSFYGIHAAADGTIISPEPTRPWPNISIWWDGDLLGDNLNENVVDKWNYASGTTSRLLTAYHYHSITSNSRSICAFQGDIIGDWREEMIFDTSTHTELVIFTTSSSTTSRIYTLAHNPAYRNDLTVQGYRQQHLPDFFLGDGMATPPTPNIAYVNTSATPSPNPMTWASVPAISGVQSISMTATTATSAGGVQYLFTCTSGSGHSSAWQSSRSYTDTGLTPGGTYGYTVKARDAVSTAQVTSASSQASVYLDTGPSPDPMTWASAPAAAGVSSITMTATTATTAGGPEYYFTCTAGAGHDSGWQSSTTYVDTGLSPLTTCTYTAKARDKSVTTRVTGVSSALSATTLSASVIPAPGAYWPLDEGSGTITKDYSGNGNDGTLTGTSLPAWDTGKYSGCLTFSGNGGHVSVPHSSSIDFGDVDFSISLWLKEPATITSGTQHDILIKGTFGSPTDAGSGRRYELYRKRDVNGDIFYWTIDDASHATELSIPASYVCTGSWVHVVAVRDSVNNQLRLYVNGVQKGLMSSVVTNISESEPLWLGDVGMSGSMDDVRIYGCVLTADQAMTLYLGYDVADTTSPSPDPMTWSSVPAATSYNSISMVASTAADTAGVEYYFANLTDPNHDSGWQSGTSFADANLVNNTTYTYRVIARDMSTWHNETDWSTEAGVTTPRFTCTASIPFDADGNCQTDLLDYALISEAWLGDTAAWTDLMRFADHWLVCNRAPAGECWQ